MWEDPGQGTRRRLSVAQAADALGITVDAVRSRVKRGTIDHERIGSRVYVLLDADESRPSHDQYTDQVGDQGTTVPEDRTAELISTLREQLQAERQAHAEARRLLAAALERIPAIKAPQQAPESRETAEEESERAEAQEGTEPPEQLSGWLAPVDKLPWWHYVLGLFLVSTATLVSFFAWQTMSTFGLNVIGNIVANVVLVWFPPAVFGFWVGLRRVNPRFKSQVIPFGLLVGLAASLGRVGQIVAVGVYLFGGKSQGIVEDISYWGVFLTGPALTGWLFYVSGVLVGNARQRRRTRRLSGTISSSPEPTTGWTPRQQAILGFAATVIAALISLMGTIGSALVASGG